MKKDIYMSISGKTRALLDRQESLDVDFKIQRKDWNQLILSLLLIRKKEEPFFLELEKGKPS